MTYPELHERALRLAGMLAARGIGRGERVAVLSPNRLATLDAPFGVPGAGAVLVALNTRLGAAEIDAIVGDCRPRLVICDEALAERVPTGIERLHVGADPRSCEYEQELAAADPVDDLLAAVESETDAISLNYTSGTTGAPKGAIYTHRGAFLQAQNAANAIGLGPESSFLWTLPMFHCNGWSYPWAVTARGARHVIVDAVRPAELWPLLRRGDISHYCCAPTVQIALINDSAARPLERPVRVAMGGAPPAPALIAAMTELGFEPMHLYGLTETYGPKTGMVVADQANGGSAELARLLARQGHPISPTDAVRVVGENLADVARDGSEMGEVVIRGETVTPGYFERELETAEAFTDGWFHTGDVAVWHPDGSIELRDRAKDIIISGGENISSIEVEQVLCEHPDVLEAAVVAVPDPHWGERPGAYVALRDGATATESELVRFCRERLAHFKCPDRIRFAELPKTATGKIRKRELREREWAGLERRIN